MCLGTFVHLGDVLSLFTFFLTFLFLYNIRLSCCPLWYNVPMVYIYSQVLLDTNIYVHTYTTTYWRKTFFLHLYNTGLAQFYPSISHNITKKSYQKYHSKVIVPADCLRMRTFISIELFHHSITYCINYVWPVVTQHSAKIRRQNKAITQLCVSCINDLPVVPSVTTVSKTRTDP